MSIPAVEMALALDTLTQMREVLIESGWTNRGSESMVVAIYNKTAAAAPAPVGPVQQLNTDKGHWETTVTTGPRKSWDDPDRPPEDDGKGPWEKDPTMGRPGESWDRFDYHEESYWRRWVPAVQQLDSEKLARAAQSFLIAENIMHPTYGSTATCRSGPGVIAGSALTPHCSIICRNPTHAEDRARYDATRLALIEAAGDWLVES